MGVMEPRTLHIDEQLKVEYCIPLWLRDEQVRLSTARVRGRIQEGRLQSQPAAIVCYGPSLNETWEEIRSYKTIISCSGSHKFLIDRGIIPTHHVEVDPREHKVALLGLPHAGVEYLIASACHPKLFDHLEGFDVRLWHVFTNELELLRLQPRGEWAITGGSNVGLRAMTIARFLGYTNLHVFGMDGCEGPFGKHAAAHPNQPQDFSVIDYEGVSYRTTTAMLQCAKETWHELDQLPDVTATFHGEGLVQAMAKRYVRKTHKNGMPAMASKKPELLSVEYRSMNEQLHRENLAYGVGGARHAAIVIHFSELLKTKNILDYGCGKGHLGKNIPWAIAEYDPAIPGKTECPKPADIVVCTDVLEHIEPEFIDLVLDDLRRCVLKAGYFTISMRPAQKTLPDGRNTHLIQKCREWWETKLERHFQIRKIVEAGSELRVVVGPKPKRK
jgi:hypothetical protein